MERFVKGDVVVIPFPYSDLTNSKRRPALVLAESSNNDFIIYIRKKDKLKTCKKIIYGPNDKEQTLSYR